MEINFEMLDLNQQWKSLDQAHTLAVKQAARQIGAEGAGFAKENCPVDTGLLRNSITFAVSGGEFGISSYKADKPNKQGVIVQGGYSGKMPVESEFGVYIGSNVKYAEIQENGDFNHKSGGKHFIKRACTEHTPRYKEIIENAFKAAEK